MNDLYESYAERQIRRAQEEGAFDRLPGAGRPLPDLDGTYDPAWWAKKWIERQRRLDRAQQAARRADRLLAQVWLLDDETQVRQKVAELNAAIRRASADLDEADRPDPLDPDDAVALWRTMRRWRTQ